MAVSIFVGDGYDLAGTVPAVAGLYPEVRFKYRPGALGIRTEYGAAAPGERAKVGARILARQVSEVSVAGEAVTMNESHFAKLHEGIASYMLDTVLGYIGPSQEQAEKNLSAA